MFQYPLTRHSPHWGKKTWCTQLIWLLLGLCALIMLVKPASSVAATIAGTWGWQDLANVPASTTPPYGLYPTAQAVCDARKANNFPTQSVLFLTTSYIPQGACHIDYSPSYQVVVAWPIYVLRCPANSSPTSSTCICYAGVPDATATSCVLQCPVGQQLNAAGTACVVTPVCPAHAHATNLPTPPCACDAGYVWDATQTSCILDCPIPDLTPMTDALALDFEKGNTWRPDLLTTPYQTKLNCVKAGFTTQGWTFVPTNGSAFRPNQYQRHFYELVAKDGALKAPNYMSTHPECQSLRTKITAEMAKHGLKPGQPVGKPGTSHHESGQAFDITPMLATGGSPSKQQVFPVYNACGVSNTKVPAEKWHVE